MNCYEMRASHTWERQKPRVFFAPCTFSPSRLHSIRIRPTCHLITTSFLQNVPSSSDPRSAQQTLFRPVPTRGINTRNFRPKVEHPRDARVSNNVYIKQSSYKQDSLIGNPRDSTQERSHVDSSAYFAVYKLHAYQACGVCPGSRRARIRESVPPSRRRSL